MDLTSSEISTIIDDRVRAIVIDWVAAHGGNPKKAFTQLPRLGPAGPLIKKARMSVKQQPSLMARVSTGYADLGSNHHVAIYQLQDGQIEFDVVSLFEASRRLAKHEQIVRRDRGDGNQGGRFVMSLSIGNTLRFAKEPSLPETYWRVQKIASKGQISLLDVADASPKEIGRVKPAND